MKTLNFKDIKGAISRNQMHLIKGGQMASLGNDGEIEAGSCGYRLPNPGGFEKVECGISRKEALSLVNEQGGHWCCNNCRSNGGVGSYC